MAAKKSSSSAEKKLNGYLKSHPSYNAFIHLLVGVGIGILLTNPYFGVHPVRWAAVFITLGLAGHLLPLLNKK